MAKPTTSKLNAITKRLKGHYENFKAREAKKKAAQTELFEQLSALVENDTTLAQKTIEVPEYWDGDVLAYVLRFHPEWKLINLDLDENEVVYVTLEEDAHYKAARWINEDLGWVFSKQVRQGSIMLDDDWLQEEDPWLYNDVLERVWQIKSLDDVDATTLGRLARYMYRGKPTLALEKPRPATPEELEDA